MYIFKVISRMLWQPFLVEGKERGRRLYILAPGDFCSNSEFIDKPVENWMAAFKSLN